MFTTTKYSFVLGKIFIFLAGILLLWNCIVDSFLQGQNCSYPDSPFYYTYLPIPLLNYPAYFLLDKWHWITMNGTGGPCMTFSWTFPAVLLYMLSGFILWVGVGILSEMFRRIARGLIKG